MNEAAGYGLRLRKLKRSQLGWVTQSPDDLVKADPVRLVSGVVEKLDVSGFYRPIKARASVTGRDSKDPQLLVALWLYGCIRGIGSARELATRCEESAPFLWLCGVLLSITACCRTSAPIMPVL